MNFSRFLLLLAAAALFSTSCTPGYKLSAEGAWAPGKTYSYRETRATITTVEDPASAETQTSFERTFTDYDWVVEKELPDKNLQVKLIFKKILQESDDQKVRQVYNSENPEADSVSRNKHRFIGPILDHPFEVIMTPSGQVLDFRGMDALWQDLEKNMADDPAAKMGIKSVRESFNDASMRNTLKNAFGFFPEKKVKTGKSWKTNTQVPRLGSDKKTVYTLTKRTDRDAEITAQSILTHNPEKPGELKMGPMTIRYFLSGDSKGIYKMDQPAAMLKYSRETMKLSGTMEIKVPFLGTQKLPTTIETEVILERLE